MPSRPITLGFLLGVVALAAQPLSPASAARPAGGSRYFGYEGSETNARDLALVSAELRVNRTRRLVSRRSYLVAQESAGDCGRSDGVRIGLAGVRIRRNGKFSARGRRGRFRDRLRGRFRTRDYARLTYRGRSPRRGRRRGCTARGTVSLYRNGEPPFSGCRSQRAKTLTRSAAGRIFVQYRHEPSTSDSFFRHVFACLFDTNRRFLLGRDYDDETVEFPRLAAPFVAFASGTTSIVGANQSIEVVDLRSGVKRSAGPVSSATEPPTGVVTDLEPRDTGSVAWISERTGSGGAKAREVWASDAKGRRMLDSGAGIAPTSLSISGSTVSWVKDGASRSAPIE